VPSRWKAMVRRKNYEPRRLDLRSIPIGGGRGGGAEFFFGEVIVENYFHFLASV